MNMIDAAIQAAGMLLLLGTAALCAVDGILYEIGLIRGALKRGKPEKKRVK